MHTLYDLIGAHPDADAGTLKKAFREAAKAHHPDLHGGDPDAAARFRQITAAKSILTDAEQRALYDQLLDFERWKFQSRKRGVVFEAARHIAADAIAVMILAVVLGGGYVAFTRVANTSSAAPVVEANVAPEPDMQTAGSVAAPDQHITYALQSAEAATVPPLPPRNDPDSYRQRGIASYRLGDITGAIADFDQAIRLDPNFAAAYVDRSIALYRLNARDRAFADIERARQIEHEHRRGAAAKPGGGSAPTQAD
jgi:curved DNA-binding protein CbpA